MVKIISKIKFTIILSILFYSIGSWAGGIGESTGHEVKSVRKIFSMSCQGKVIFIDQLTIEDETYIHQVSYIILKDLRYSSRIYYNYEKESLWFSTFIPIPVQKISCIPLLFGGHCVDKSEVMAIIVKGPSC